MRRALAETEHRLWRDREGRCQITSARPGQVIERELADDLVLEVLAHEPLPCLALLRVSCGNRGLCHRPGSAGASPGSASIARLVAAW
jgi:hypothetical protein